MAGAQRGSRNRAPCAACQTSKRRCDLIRPSCTRCTERKIPCIPSRQARWRVAGLSRNSPSTFTFASDPDVDDLGEEPSPPRAIIDYCQQIDCGSRDQTRLADLNEIQQHQLDGESTVQELDGFDFSSLIGDTSLASISSYSALEQTSATQHGECLVDFPSLVLDRSTVNGSYFDLSLPEEMITTYTDDSISSNLSSVVNNGNMLARYASPQLGGDIISRHLWNMFFSVITVQLTPLQRQEDNPIVGFLAAQAMVEPAIYAAVVYFSNKLMTKRSSALLEHTSTSEEQVCHLGPLGRSFELQSTEILNRAVSVSSSDSAREALLLSQFATMITMSTAYIADGSLEKQHIHLEMALVFVQSVFKRFQTNDTFLYLLKWLGFIHTTAMLSFGSYNIKAPDYVTIATESQTLNKLHKTSRGRRNQVPPHSFVDHSFVTSNVHLFEDVDYFLGISAALSNVMYKLGRLYRLRRAAIESDESSQWFWQDFEAEADDLEIRLEQQLAMTRRSINENMSLSALDSYNTALLHSLKLIFQNEIRASPLNEREEDKMVGDILEFCASIPAESQVATLSVFPLFHAGMRSRRHLHREFVRSRLTEMTKTILVADIGRILKILKARWEEYDGGSPLSNCEDEWVCILF